MLMGQGVRKIWWPDGIDIYNPRLRFWVGPAGISRPSLDADGSPAETHIWHMHMQIFSKRRLFWAMEQVVLWVPHHYISFASFISLLFLLSSFCDEYHIKAYLHGTCGDDIFTEPVGVAHKITKSTCSICFCFVFFFWNQNFCKLRYRSLKLLV